MKSAKKAEAAAVMPKARLRLATKAKIVLAAVCVIVAAALVGNILYFKKYDYAHLLNTTTPLQTEAFRSLGTDTRLPYMEKAAENDRLALFVSTRTAEIAVWDKGSGEMWYSNPPGRENDPLANDVNKNLLNSQFDVGYYDKDRNEQYFYSHSDAVAKGQFEIKSIPEGVRITYTLGDLSLGASALPKYISAERLEEKVLSKVTDEKVRKSIVQYYTAESDKESLLKFQEAALKSELITGRILKGFEGAGYTEEDLAYDNEQAGISIEQNLQYAVIPLDFQLNKDRLTVTVRGKEIEETDSIKLRQIDLLCYFGAGSTQEEGYLLVPSGCGGLIRFNNGKVNEDVYVQPIYGDDLMTSGRTRVQVTEPARLPAFGISKSGAGMLACVGQGAAVTEVQAEVSGKISSYNNVYPRFVLRTSDKIDMSSAATTGGAAGTMTIVEQELFRGDMSVDYCFLKKQDADYSGMARYYRNRLEEEGVLKETEAAGEAPFFLDLLGVAEREMFVMGVPYNGHVDMTSYQQADVLLDELEERGITNVQLRYKGWFNQGMNNDTPKNVKPISSLGSMAELQGLEKRLSAKGGGVYPDASFQKVAYRTGSYSPVKDSSRYLDGYNAVVMDVSRVTLRMNGLYNESIYHVVSPNVLPEIVGSFLPKYEKKVGVGNLALQDLGSQLNSDKNRKYPINRTVAEAIVSEQLEAMSGRNQLMIAGGNQYALPYATALVDTPAVGNRFYLIDEIVPFYQMVIHGYMDYAGSAANSLETYNSRDELLHTLEFGMSPHYVWSYQNSDQMEASGHANYYSTNYRFWLADAVKSYQEASPVIQQVRRVKMKQHIIHQEGVRETVYENGVAVLVNYTNQPVRVNGVLVEAKDYAVTAGKGVE